MQPKEVVNAIKKKRLVFTVTTGRSGTAYLSTILGLAKNVYSVHEPAPEFADLMRDVQGSPEAAAMFFLEKKLPAILACSADVYIETSHLACKGFLLPLLELGVVPDIIIHTRPARDVSLSLLKMGTIPGRSRKSLRFYLTPEDPGVLSLPGWQNLQDYQLCYWYCLEIERRAIVYKKIFIKNGARVASTTLEGLKTFAGLLGCFSDLDLTARSPRWFTALRFSRAAGVKVNESLDTKKQVAIPEDLEGLEQEVKHRVETPNPENSTLA
jgi:hypothetical protein